MKLLTINTHSLIEEDSNKKAEILSNTIIEELPEVVALQEVNQSISANKIDCPFEFCKSTVRRDNYAVTVLNKLNNSGVKYHAAWLPVKIGYEKYDEGLAILSRLPILDTDNLLISSRDNYNNWKTRRVLGIRNSNGWFYSVHMGWWSDEEEPFESQWKRFAKSIATKEKIWIMGDFNSCADTVGEGYTLITQSGWYDSYCLAEVKDNGFTVDKKIDGWEDSKKMRIDYIFSNFKATVKKSQVIFNGINRDFISDHYGIIIETKEC